jgi:hypothetical protein
LKSSIESRKNAAKGYFNLGFKKSKPQDKKDKSKDDIILEKDEELLQKLKEARELVQATADKEPRTFNLTKEFYTMRLTSKRNAQISKQTAQKMSQPDFFPKVPSHAPGAPSASFSQNTGSNAADNDDKDK